MDTLNHNDRDNGVCMGGGVLRVKLVGLQRHLEPS